MLDIDSAVDAAIQQTERYYREMIFSTGCSSLVAIYRIAGHTNSIDAIVRQLEGSPYIQKGLPFDERVIQMLLDVDLYVYEDKHMFLQCDLDGEVAEFIDQCEKVASFDKVVRPLSKDGDAKDFFIDASVEQLKDKYPVIGHLDLKKVLSQIDSLSKKIDFETAIDGYLQVFQHQEWVSKHEINRTSLICMVSIGNRMALGNPQLKELVTLGLLKDIGYARLEEFVQDFEVLHPLVSHTIVSEANENLQHEERRVSENVLNAILLHHEFTDHSGPLARMRHPSVTGVLDKGMPVIAQISGICDLYLGFFENYNPAEAFALTCGYVFGQGDVQPRYSSVVVKAFIDDFRKSSYHWGEQHDNKNTDLVATILNTLKEPRIQEKAAATIKTKSTSEYEHITLALNLVRNVARKNPQHIGEISLVQALHLPLEFGLNYD